MSTRRFSSVLDVGCGEGYTQAMGLSGVVGIDIVGGENVTVLASAEYLPFRDSCFQLVFAGEVVEHLARPIQSLKDWVRVLGKGGTMVVSTPNGLRVAAVWNPDHKRVFAPQDLSRTLGGLGLEVTKVRGIFVGLGFGWRLFRWIPSTGLKMAVLRFPSPVSLTYDVFFSAEKV